MKGTTLFQGEIITKKQNCIEEFKKSSPDQNHLANFNQIWHKASLGEVTQVFTNKDNLILKKEIVRFFPLQINVMI